MRPAKLWAEREDLNCIVPLLCRSKSHAKNVLTQWCKGKHLAHRDSDGEVEVTIKPDGTRNRDDMEIVKVEFKLP